MWKINVTILEFDEQKQHNVVTGEKAIFYINCFLEEISVKLKNLESRNKVTYFVNSIIYVDGYFFHTNISSELLESVKE